jgi:hypothetical protein
MKPAPYTIITAYHQEMEHWRLGPADKALLMAFVWCLKLRMDGTDPNAICGPSHIEARRKKK